MEPISHFYSEISLAQSQINRVRKLAETYNNMQQVGVVISQQDRNNLTKDTFNGKITAKLSYYGEDKIILEKGDRVMFHNLHGKMTEYFVSSKPKNRITPPAFFVTKTGVVFDS